MEEGAGQEMTEQEEFEFRHRLETEQAAGAPPPEKGLMEQLVKPAVLPTGGAIAGAAFGAGVGTPFGMSVPGGIVGGAVGASLGEAANQMLGITEPSVADIALSGGVTAVAGGAGTALRVGREFVAPARAARTLNALAPEEMAMRLKNFDPAVPSSVLFKQATAQKSRIPLKHTGHTVDLMLDDLTQVSQGVQNVNQQAITYLKGMKELIEGQASGLTPDRLQRELEGVGKIVSSLKASGGSGSGAVKLVFKSMMKDLDEAAAAGTPGAKTLEMARDTFKKESVLREIGEAVEGATKSLRGQGEHVQFNANAVIKEIQKNEFYKSAMSAAEQEEIEGVLKLLNKIPALRPGAGQQYGSGQMSKLARNTAVGGAVGASIGAKVGEPALGGTIGAGIGAAVGPVSEFAKNLTLTLQMKTGRAMLKELLTQSKGIATPQVSAVMGAYAEAVRAGQVNE